MHKRSSTYCPHCRNHQTLHHILNHCSVFLSQGRYTWRHKSVLNHLVLALSSAYSNGQIFADLRNCLSPSWPYFSAAFPSDILCTSQRPDLVLIFPDKKSSCLNWLILLKLNLKLLIQVHLTNMPLLSPTLVPSFASVRSFLLSSLNQEASSWSLTSTPLLSSFPQSRLFTPNAFVPSFPALLPSALTPFSALVQTPPGFHRHFLLCLPPLDPDFSFSTRSISG